MYIPVSHKLKQGESTFHKGGEVDLALFAQLAKSVRKTGG